MSGRSAARSAAGAASGRTGAGGPAPGGAPAANGRTGAGGSEPAGAPRPARVAAADANQAHLLARLALVGDRVDALVRDRKDTEPAEPDPLRGLYLTGDAVEALLARPAEPRLAAQAVWAAVAVIEARADEAVAAGADLRLRRLATAFELSGLEVETLLVAVAPDLDTRFEQFYGFLNDDVTQRRATPRLVAELLGETPLDGEVRAAVDRTSRLVTTGLLTVGDTDRPALSRVLQVPDAVTAFLLGRDDADADLNRVTTGPPLPAGDPAELAPALAAGVRLVYLRGRPDTAGRGLATRALDAAGWAVVSVDLARWAGEPDTAELARALARHATLHHAGVVAGPVEALLPERAGALAELTDLPVPTVLLGAGPFDPHWTARVPLLADAEPLTAAERAQVWRTALGDALPAGVDPLAETSQFRLGPDGIARAARAAVLHAVRDGGPVDGVALRAGARAQNAAGLDRLVRRVRPAVGWDDLVLPARTRAQLVEVAARARHRERVLGEWRMRPGGGVGHGVSALFTGEPGTGKTMSAEVLAGDLGLDLYVVNLATVVDKYVGETEKKLERIFDEAATVNGVLLFDEADALFGKRSEVHDAHDRYANVEVAYLLQRMETFDGFALLATNLSANIDEAFTRRLDAVIDFPRPDEPRRRELWAAALRPLVERGGQVDLDWCARSFDLSGGEIRSASVTAAYLAVTDAAPLSMRHVVRAVEREYRKHGRLLPAATLGPYAGLADAGGGSGADGAAGGAGDPAGGATRGR